jgi:hypothetical protein
MLTANIHMRKKGDTEPAAKKLFGVRHFFHFKVEISFSFLSLAAQNVELYQMKFRMLLMLRNLGAL